MYVDVNVDIVVDKDDTFVIPFMLLALSLLSLESRRELNSPVRDTRHTGSIFDLTP